MSNYQQQILSLIEDTQEFTYLHNHFNRFNPFKVLQVDNYEIRHSNVLAWLMDSKQNHDLGSFFIKKLIAKVFVNPVNFEDEDKISNYDVLQLSRHAYDDLVAYKELATSKGKRIDLLAVSHLHRVVVLIENKYWSKESVGQLEDYIEFVRQEYEGYKIIPVFLTLQDEEPTHADYLMLGYSDVLDILKNMTIANKDYMNPNVHSFIAYYIDILEDQLIQNDELNEKGMSLYKNHKEAVELLSAAGKGKVDVENDFANELVHIYSEYKEAIDLIVKVGDSLLHEAFTRFAKVLEWPEHLYTPHFRTPNFVEQTWYEHFEASDLRKKWWMDKGLIVWFEQADNRLKLKVEVGPLYHEDRVRLLKVLTTKGINVREQAFEEGRQYTRIYMDAEHPGSWEDVDSLVECMLRLYRKDSFQSLLRLINEAVKTRNHESVPYLEPEVITGHTPLEQAFTLFVNEKQIPYEGYNIHRTLPSFMESEWKALPSKYKVSDKYWLGYPLIAWFEIRNSAIRLIVEVGPLPHLERTQLLRSLEKQGIPVRALAYEEGRRFTRIFSRAVSIANPGNVEELKTAMDQLISGSEYVSTKKKMERAITALGMDN